MAGFSKWAILDADVYDGENGSPRKVFDPHSGQLEVLEDDHRMQIVIAGRRFGKSFLGGNELLPEAALTRRMASTLKRDGKRREFWIVGPEYSDAEKEFRVFYNQCTRLEIPFDKPGTYYSVESGSMSVSLWDGAFILHAKSAKIPERLVGEGLSGVIMSEAAKQKERIWKQYIRPTLSDFNGWAKFTTTPEGKNWLYNLFLKAINKNNPQWWGYRGPSWRNNIVYDGQETRDDHVRFMIKTMVENPGLTSYEVATSFNLSIHPEILDLANDLTAAEFQQEICADFTDFVGKVFKDFDDEVNVRDLPFHLESNWETIAAVDYGFQNPNVWLLIQIGPYGEINVVDEMYESELAPDEFAREILRRGLCPDSCTAFYPDPALPGYSKTIETILSKAGKRCRAQAHTGGELVDRLNLIRLALRNRIPDVELSMPLWTQDDNEPGTEEYDREGPRSSDIRRPQMMFHPRCHKTIYEFNEYRYPDRKDKAETSTKRFDLPMKEDDHTPEAIGRFLAGKYHSAAAQYGAGARVSKANFVRGLGRNNRANTSPHPVGVRNTDIPVRRGPWVQDR